MWQWAGPAGGYHLRIAPVCYCSHLSYIRQSVNIHPWIVVFCCTVTGAVDSRVMEKYTADVFILAFKVCQ